VGRISSGSEPTPVGPGRGAGGGVRDRPGPQGSRSTRRQARL